jgi:hypothetical protein
MFRRVTMLATMMVVIASFALAYSGKDAKAYDEVPSVFSTHFVEEYPVLSGAGEARAAAQATANPSIKILMLKGGLAEIGAALHTLPVIRKTRQVVIGVAEDRRGRRVHFKVVRGGSLPAHERATATYPRDMAFCMTDDEGRTLFQLTVGDAIGDSIPECGPHSDDSIEARVATSDDLPPVHVQRGNTMAAIKTMGALAKLEFDSRFDIEARVLTEQRDFFRKAHRPNEEIVASDEVIILNERGEPVLNGTTLAEADLALALRAQSSSDLARPQVTWFRGRRHAVQAHAAWIHGLAALAEHSATYTARYEENPAPFGSYYDIKTNCNHGRCPNEMPRRYLILTEPRSATHVHNWKCVTAYNSFSWTGTHNCNDDTVTETRSVRFDTHWNELFGSPCSDPYIRRLAPGPWE